MPVTHPQLPLGIHLRDSASLDSFLPGPNAELVGVLGRLVGAGASHEQLPVMHFVWGGAGCGKTHLLQGVCRAAASAGHTVAYLPLPDLADGDAGILAGLAGQSLVCLDDVQAIAGRRGWEEALVALCDGIRLNGGRLLASGRHAPPELGLQLRDLSSRLAWGPVYALRALGDEDKLQLLRQRARARGLEMPDEVGRFLMTRGSREIPALMDALDRLDHASLAAQRRLTLPFVREVLAGGR
jgi:DnaA family protein